MPVRFLLFVLGLGLVASAAAQDGGEAPLFETRAVWFATVLRDGGWPGGPADPPDVQARALRERIRQAHALGINTFVMQVVARGDALYPSEHLPWAHQLKAAGEDPGYDPLAVAIDEAHRLGMELHAWVNVFRVGDSRTESIYRNAPGPPHVMFAHPEWVQEKDQSYWIDPSSEEARAWLVGIVREIVETYDVDGIHFDFIRYPQGGLNDDGASFQFDPNGYDDIGAWRRANVTGFVAAAYAAVMEVRPWVKVGSAPVGNYQDNGLWPALWGYSDVFQESRAWLTGGINDYLAPQIYWGLGMTPDFDVLVREWEAASSGLPLFAGIAAYGPAEGTFPAADLPLLIDAARAAGAEGQVFFRYDHFLQYADLITTRYPHPALPAPMWHRFEARAPSTPGGVALTQEGTLAATLTWTASEGTAADPLRGYAVFRNEGAPPDPTNAAHLHAVTGSAASFTDVYEAAPAAPLYYRVAAVSRLGLVSDASEPVSTAGMPLAAGGETPESTFRIEAFYPNPAASPVTVTYEVRQGADVTLEVYDALGRVVATPAEGWHAPGTYRVTIDPATWAAGVYLCSLQSGAHRAVERLVVR